MKPSKLASLALAGLALLVFAYANSFHNHFHFADTSAIPENPALSLPYTLAEIFSNAEISNTESAHQRYQPFVTMLLIANRALGGVEPAAYRWISLGLYAILCISMWGLFSILQRSRHFAGSSNIVPLVAAAVFTLSAVQAESVNYISARGQIIAAIGLVWALALFVRGKGARTSKFYLVPAALAALSSELALCFPLLLFAYISLFGGEQNEPFSRRLARSLIGSLPAGMVCIPFVLLSLSLSSPESISLPSVEHISLQPYAWLMYASSFVYPFALSASPSLTSGPALENLASLCGVVALCALLTITVTSLREKELRLMGFGLVWFLIGLVPSMLVIGDGSGYFDYRRALYSYGGLSLALTHCGYSAGVRLMQWRRWRRRYAYYALILGLAVLASHVLMTRQRNRVWSSEETLWFDVLRHNPRDGKALMNYGSSKMLKGDTDIARMYFEDALQLLPDEAALHERLGTLHGIITRDPSVAQDYFDTARALDPERGETYVSYARWLLERKRFDEAIEAAERARDLQPRDATPYYTLLDIYDQLGRWSKVVELAQALLEISPDDPVATRLLSQADERIKNRRRS